MTRAFAKVVSRYLYSFSISTKYPTRTVESAFAWIQIVWSYSVIVATPMLVGRGGVDIYGPMLHIMPAMAWGVIGFTIGVVRVIALFANGHWRPSPEFRLVGAAWGLMFWLALYTCYWIAIENGATDFPMRRAFLVFIVFEAYSCYRCGQDIGFRQVTEKTDSSLRGSVGADYG